MLLNPPNNQYFTRDFGILEQFLAKAHVVYLSRQGAPDND